VGSSAAAVAVGAGVGVAVQADKIVAAITSRDSTKYFPFFLIFIFLL
jgi:hypothetical protein